MRVAPIPGLPARSAARAFEALPGALAWAALGGVIVGAILAPGALLAGVAGLACYCAGRFVAAMLAVRRGLRLIRDWEHMPASSADIQEQPASRTFDPAMVHHLVLLPNYQEPHAVLKRTLRSLAALDDAPRMIVVLAMEGAEENAGAKAHRLQSDFEGRFAQILITVHPANLPEELRCKSANLRWALDQAQRALAHTADWQPEHVIVTAMDADTLWHPAYFARLRALFAYSPDRYHTLWQAPIRYHANVWDTHPFLRILHAYASAWELAYLAAPWWQALPMSSYSLSLKLLNAAESWDGDAIADEWHLAIKAFFAHGARLRVEPIFLPFLAQAAGRGSLQNALRERYHQTFRHAWGAREIGYVVEQITAHPEVPLRRGLGLLLRVAHDNLLAGAGWIVLALGSQLPLLLHPDQIAARIHSPAFILIQAAFALLAALTAVVWGFDLFQRPPRPTSSGRQDRLLELVGLPLTALLTALTVALPVLQAHTWLLLGKSIDFRVTPKS